MNRIARPSRARPRPQRRNPVNAALSASTAKVAVSRPPSLPFASSRAASVATSAAITAQVEPSGPPIANGSELRNDVTAPPIAPVMNVAVRP